MLILKHLVLSFLIKQPLKDQSEAAVSLLRAVMMRTTLFNICKEDFNDEIYSNSYSITEAAFDEH